MGTWGSSIFSSDLAADVRGDFRELIEDGASVTEATTRVLDRYAEVANESPCPTRAQGTCWPSTKATWQRVRLERTLAPGFARAAYARAIRWVANSALPALPPPCGRVVGD